MSYKEIYDNLSKDFEKVYFKIEQLAPKATKALKNSHKFPSWKLYKYKIPSTNNEYIIYFYTHSMLEKPAGDFFCIISDDKNKYVVRYFLEGYKHTANSPTQQLPVLHFYTDHFWNRYKERCLKDKVLNNFDAACRYFTYNIRIIPIYLNQEINRNLSTYGEGAKRALVVDEGICFTDSGLEKDASQDGNKEKDKCKVFVFINKTRMPENLASSTLILN